MGTINHKERKEHKEKQALQHFLADDELRAAAIDLGLHHANPKAPKNRSHSKRFALAAESVDHTPAFGLRA